MGVTGLLKAVAGIQTPAHIRDFRNKRVAIDGHAWLHRGAYCCATELYLGSHRAQHVDFCMKRLSLLIGFGVIPVRPPLRQAERESARAHVVHAPPSGCCCRPSVRLTTVFRP
eukprot:GHVU01196102.1.p1 GENE.GHVU01196102.1~~GHVU01196102.1.p1  ORF type:complete len:113 (+),score=8.02 GHVU01196102.1:256-594(+)